MKHLTKCTVKKLDCGYNGNKIIISPENGEIIKIWYSSDGFGWQSKSSKISKEEYLKLLENFRKEIRKINFDHDWYATMNSGETMKCKGKEEIEVNLNLKSIINFLPHERSWQEYIN